MNKSIVGLGEAIISEYYNKLSEWSALAELTFSKEDLSASFGMVDDILRLEDDWQEFVALIQTLQTDYLPQDLLEISKTGALPPEQQQQLSYPVKKMNNYPFTVLPGTGESLAFPAGLEDQPAKNETAGYTDGSIPGSGFDFPEVKQASSRNIESENSLFIDDHPVRHKSGNIPADSAKEVFNMSFEDMSDQANQSSFTWDKLDSPDTQQIAAHEMAPESDPYSASIWNQPLQNLGDFASQITYPVPTHRNQNIPSSGHIQPVEYSPGRATYPGRIASEESGNQSTGQSPKPEWPATPVFIAPMSPGLAEPPSQNGELIDFQPENQLFQSAIPPQTILPDTDELLEALTDRIRRDFRRYYP